jgi:hypothetical protein
MLIINVDKYSKQPEYRQNQRDKKEKKRVNSNIPIREPYYYPPEFRGFRVYGNLDLGYLRMIYVSLWDSGRISSFHVRREKPEDLGKRPRLDDGNNNWWLDDKGSKKKFGCGNLDKELCRLMPGVRRFE